MTSKFFSKYIGRNCDHQTLVYHDAELGAAVQLDVDTASTLSPILYLTPEQAKALGRALIKAGKFVEKEAKK